MSNSLFNQVRAAITQRAAATGNPEDLITCRRVFDSTISFMRKTNAVAGAGAALESFESVPQLNDGVNVVATNGIAAIESFVSDCGVPHTRRQELVCDIARILQNEGAGSFFAESHVDGATEGFVPMHRVTGTGAYGAIAADAGSLQAACEAFGIDMDKVQVDARLNIALSVMRTFKNLLDRVMPRQSQETNTVTIKVPAPEVYDLAKSQDAKASVRNGMSHRVPLVSLFKDPSPVNTTPKKIVPLPANDVETPSVMLGNALKTGAQINLFDLAMDSNKIGYNHIDYTDLVSEGGVVRSVYVLATKVDGGTTTELFEVQVKHMAAARFTSPANSADSGDRQAGGRLTAAIRKGSKEADGSTSVMFSTYDGVTINLDLSFNATLNLKTAQVQGNGSVAASVVSQSPSAVPGAITTDFAKITFSVVAWEPELYYSEENLRKTTTAVRLNYRQQQFEIPVGRTTIVDYSLAQQQPEDVLNVVSTTMALGNTKRGLSVVESVLNDVYDRVQFEKNHAELPFTQTVAAEFAAGTLVLPNVIKSTIDFAAGPQDIAVMKESERLTELHSRFLQHMLSITATLEQRSLYGHSLEGNETPVYKLIVGSVVANLVIGILQYHNVFNDKVNAVAGADYSMLLPNGTRLDIVKTNFNEYADKIVMFPIRENDPTHVTSFGAIQDRGTFVAQYTPVNNGAANKRVVTNSREIPFITNAMGAIITVAGLGSQITQFA